MLILYVDQFFKMEKDFLNNFDSSLFENGNQKESDLDGIHVDILKIFENQGIKLELSKEIKAEIDSAVKSVLFDNMHPDQNMAFHSAVVVLEDAEILRLSHASTPKHTQLEA